MYEYLYDLINGKNDNPIGQHFNKTLFGRGSSIDESSGMPDISGYVLIYLKPPTLSGLSTSFIDQSKNFIFLAQDFTPPDTQITNNDISSTVNIKIPFGVGKSAGGNLSISFLENTRLDIYSFHHSWFHYIEQVILGDIEPSDYYITSGTLDYATCAYIIKYKPDLTSITYIGKAIGLFPISMPVKELIGSRGSHQTTVFGVTYICTDYQDIVLKGDGTMSPSSNMSGTTDWVIEDFQNDVYQLFNTGVMGMDIFGIGSLLSNNPITSIVNSVSSAVTDLVKTGNSIVSSVGSLGSIVTSSINSTQTVLTRATTNITQSATTTISNAKNIGTTISTSVKTSINTTGYATVSKLRALK